MLAGRVYAASSQNFSINDGSMSGAGTSSSQSFSNTGNVFIGSSMQSSNYSVGGSSSGFGGSSSSNLSSQTSSSGGTKRGEEIEAESTSKKTTTTSPKSIMVTKTTKTSSATQKDPETFQEQTNKPVINQTITKNGKAIQNKLSQAQNEKSVPISEFSEKTKTKGVMGFILAIIALIGSGVHFFISKKKYSLPKGKFPVIKSWRED